MRRGVGPLLVLCAMLAAPALRAADDDLGLDDLGAAAKIDAATEAKVQAHVAEARRLMEKGDYPAARRELDAADALVPMHDDVLDAYEQLGALEDEARANGQLVERLEKERAVEEARAAKAADARRKVDDEVAQVIRRRRLPERLDLAIVALKKRRDGAARRQQAAERVRDKCIAAAALAHAPAGARRCRPAEEKVEAAKTEVRALDADLDVLTTTYRDRKGAAALDALLPR